MLEKKRFILKVPFFLATEAASPIYRFLYACCFGTMILGYKAPLVGTIASLVFCLAVWQFISIKTKHDQKYHIYNRFLLQRVALCSAIVLIMTVYCSVEGQWNTRAWNMMLFALGSLNLFDLFMAAKGLVGVGYIHGSQD